MLEVLVKKTETIRKELGSLAKVIDDDIERQLAHGIRHRDADRLAREIEVADLDAEKKRITEEEFEAARDRQEDLKKQIARCQSLLEASRTWTNFEAAPFREALSCSLELLGAEPLIETTDEEGARVWTFPPLGLMKLAEEMLASSALLMKAAHKIPHREKRQCMEINSYIKQGHVCADEVRRIAKPLLDLEADKRAARPDQANVVEGKFPAAAASS